MRTLTLLALAPLCSPPLSAAPADDPAAGFALESLPYPGGALTTTLSSGEVVAFDGDTVDLYDADGLLLSNLTSFASFVHPSFLLVDEAQGLLVIGESSNGVVYRMALAPGVANPVVTLDLNYDAVFEDPDHLLVSAASRGFGAGNQIFRVNVDTGLALELCDVAGASGPLCLDANGDLVYGTVTDAWPPPAGSSSVLRWSAAQLTGAPVLTEADAVVLESGLDGAASLALDPASGALYLAENNFGSGLNRVRRVGGGANAVLVEGVPFQSIGNLEFVPGDGVAAFVPYQPRTGGLLRYNTTDFFSVYQRLALQPRRPVAVLSGAGLSGPGELDLSLAHGPAGGFGIVFHDLNANLPASEYALQLSFPLFLGLSLAGVGRVPGVVALDTDGRGGVTYTNPGGLEGRYTLQALLFDAGARLVGSSTSAAL